MTTDGRIHLGTLGMGIPRIYSDVVALIVSNHLAIESTFIKRINARSLAPKTEQFFPRLTAIQADLGTSGNDWAIEACRKLNKVRNNCAHIDSADYQSLEIRLLGKAEEFCTFVKIYNRRLDAHKISDFEWACTMTYQRLYEIFGLDYDPLVIGSHDSLSLEMRQVFVALDVQKIPDATLVNVVAKTGLDKKTFTNLLTQAGDPAGVKIIKSGPVNSLESWVPIIKRFGAKWL